MNDTQIQQISSVAEGRRTNTRTIMVAAALGAAVGILLVPINIYSIAVTMTMPLLVTILYGTWGLAALIPLALLRKPGAGILGSTVAGLISVPFTSYGLMMVVMMLLWGVLMELPWIVTRYRLWSYKMFAISGAIIGVIMVAMSYMRIALDQMSPWVVAAVWATEIVSSMICFVASKAIAGALVRTGIMGPLAGVQHSATSGE